MCLGSILKRKVAESILKITRARLSTMLLVGLALRLILAPFTCHPYDVTVLYGITNDLLAGLNVYATNSFSYPPLWSYIEYPALRFASFFVSPQVFGLRLDSMNLMESWKLPPVVTSPLFNIISKLPLIVADVLIGIIIYDVVRKLKDEESAKLSFFLWFFNPLVVTIDSIHGQFDVLPALMTVLALCLFCRRRYFACGIAIGIGSLFKIYPVFLAPLYLFSIASFETDKSLNVSNNISKILTGCLRFVAGMMVTFLIFLLPLVNSNLVHDVFSRTSIIPTIGGLTLFNVAYCPGFEWLLPFISANATLVSMSLVILSFFMTIFISVVSFFRRSDFLRTMVLGHIAILLTTYLTSTTVNPQYMLWILPFLVLSYGLYRYNLIKLNVLSVSSLVFLMGLSGPLFFIYPLATHVRLVNVDTINTNVYFFEHIGGWALLLVPGILGAITLLICLMTTLRSLLKRERESGILDSPHKERTENNGRSTAKFNLRMVNPLKILALVVTVLLIGQILAFAQPLVAQSPVFHVDSFSILEGGYVKADYQMKSGGYPMSMQVFATPVTYIPNGTSDKEVLIFYDKEYPSSLVGEAGWVGLLDHIPIELELGGYNGSIKIVGAVELRNRMQEGHGFIVIIPSGVFQTRCRPKTKPW